MTDSQILENVKEHLEKNTIDIISFSKEHKSYCVGIIDIVNSTKIIANLANSKICEYYSIFLNIMSIIAKKFDAKIIKNIGDSLLFYFPKTLNASKFDLINSISCAYAMIDCNNIINKKLNKEGLPKLDYRISLDYGTLLLAKSSISTNEDIFGSTVNFCVKINRLANQNEMVIGITIHHT